MKKRLWIIFTLILCLFFVTSCKKPQDVIKNPEDFDLISVESMDQLKKLTKPASEFPWWRWWSNDKVADDLAGGPPVPEAGDEDKNTTSKTNVQVEGVDESDVVKNDDRYIYIVNYVGLSIVDTETEKFIITSLKTSARTSFSFTKTTW